MAAKRKGKSSPKKKRTAKPRASESTDGYAAYDGVLGKLNGRTVRSDQMGTWAFVRQGGTFGRAYKNSLARRRSAARRGRAAGRRRRNR